MTKRTVFHVVYDSERKWWVAKVGGEIIDVYYEKEPMVGDMRAKCRSLWRCFGIPSQLVIHTKTGIATEHTYGNDPKRSRG